MKIKMILSVLFVRCSSKRNFVSFNWVQCHILNKVLNRSESLTGYETWFRNSFVRSTKSLQRDCTVLFQQWSLKWPSLIICNCLNQSKSEYKAQDSQLQNKIYLYKMYTIISAKQSIALNSTKIPLESSRITSCEVFYP